METTKMIALLKRMETSSSIKAAKLVDLFNSDIHEITLTVLHTSGETNRWKNTTVTLDLKEIVECDLFKQFLNYIAPLQILNTITFTEQIRNLETETNPVE